VTIPRARPSWSRARSRLHEVIFESDTPGGRLFDLALLAAILLSVAIVLLESVPEVRRIHGRTLVALEWGFTLLFTAEYALRLAAVRHPLRYAASLLGVIDLLAIVPTYLALVVPHTQALMVIRALRLLRVFRVLKMARFLEDAQTLIRALQAARRKIIVFGATALNLVLITGALMYLVEGEANGFTSIPLSMYWAVVTMTTVGYGDVVPQTGIGKVLAALMMILGYSVIAVPTSIVSVELAYASRAVSGQACPACGAEGHDADARHCKRCGAPLSTAP
jgi:voltage-gated potassium channel